MGTWGWAALGVLAALGVYAVATKVSAAEKEKEKAKESAKDLCVDELQGKFKTDAQKVIALGDVELIESFAQQSDSKGWHCAAKELRAEAKKWGAPPAERTLAYIPEPQRSAWKKLLDRAKTESSGQLVLDLLAASQDVSKAGYEKVEKQLDDAVKAVRSRVSVDDVKEEVVIKARPASVPAASIPMMKFAPSDDLYAYANTLKEYGYDKAADQANTAAVAARDAEIKKEKEIAATCEGVFMKLPTKPLQYTKSPTFTEFTAPAYVRDVRDWVQRVYKLAPAESRNVVALVLEDEINEMSKLIGGATEKAYADNLKKAIACLRAGPGVKLTFAEGS